MEKHRPGRQSPSDFIEARRDGGALEFPLEVVQHGEYKGKRSAPTAGLTSHMSRPRAHRCPLLDLLLGPTPVEPAKCQSSRLSNCPPQMVVVSVRAGRFERSSLPVCRAVGFPLLLLCNPHARVDTSDSPTSEPIFELHLKQMRVSSANAHTLAGFEVRT